MTDMPISRFPVPDLDELPEDIRARILTSMRPNDEFYLMGRLPR